MFYRPLPLLKGSFQEPWSRLMFSNLFLACTMVIESTRFYRLSSVAKGQMFKSYFKCHMFTFLWLHLRQSVMKCNPYGLNVVESAGMNSRGGRKQENKKSDALPSLEYS
jgi:hypothetical protein